MVKKMNEKNKTDDKQSKSGKKTRKFNFIDAVLIIIILLVGAAVVNVFSPFSWLSNLRSDSTREIQYTVELSGVDGEYIDAIKENDTVVDSVSKYTLGTVKAVDYNTQYTVLEYDEVNQAGVLAAYPNKYNVLVTMTATASYKEGEGYSVNNYRIAVGEKLALRFPDFTGEGYCISISQPD